MMPSCKLMKAMNDISTAGSPVRVAWPENLAISSGPDNVRTDMRPVNRRLRIWPSNNDCRFNSAPLAEAGSQKSVVGQCHGVRRVDCLAAARQGQCQRGVEIVSDGANELVPVVDRLAVDRGDDVAFLKPGSFSGATLGDRADLGRSGARDAEAPRLLLCARLGGDCHDHLLAVAHDAEIERLIGGDQNTNPELIPILERFAVDADDAVVALQSCGAGRRVDLHEAQDNGVVGIRSDTDSELVHAHSQNEGEDHVHRWTGEQDDQSLPFRLVQIFEVRAAEFLVGILAREDLDADPECFGEHEVAELMHKDEHAEDEDQGQGVGRDIKHGLFGRGGEEFRRRCGARPCT